jgi:hypothetical protein
MFVEIAFPFTDLRGFYGDCRGRVPRPDWPTPRIKTPGQSADFIRGVGAVMPRPRGGITGRAGEDVLCEAAGAVVFPELAPAVRICFRRFFTDGRMCARLSVGLAGRLSELATGMPQRRPLDAALTAIMALPVRVGPLRFGFPQRGLIFIGGDAARYVQVRTTRHRSVQQPNRRHVLPEAPVLLIEVTERELREAYPAAMPSGASVDTRGAAFARMMKSASPVVSLAAAAGVQPPKGLADVLAWTAVAPDGGYIRCFMLVHEEGSGARTAQGASPSIRALRILLLRLVTERQNIRRLFEWLDKVDAAEAGGAGLDADAIQTAFADAERTLRRLEATDSAPGQIAERLAQDYVESAHPGESESLRANLVRIFTRRTVLAKAETFLADDRNRVQVVQHFYAGSMGAGMMGDDYRGSNIVAGAVGSGAKAKDFEIKEFAQTSNAGEAQAALAADLLKLVAAMREQASHPEQEVAAENVEKAADAAKQGKEGHVLAYLKSAGKWALDVAEKIGVAVAAASIRTALGLP